MHVSAKILFELNDPSSHFFSSKHFLDAFHDKIERAVVKIV